MSACVRARGQACERRVGARFRVVFQSVARRSFRLNACVYRALPVVTLPPVQSVRADGDWCQKNADLCSTCVLCQKRYDIQVIATFRRIAFRQQRASTASFSSSAPFDGDRPRAMIGQPDRADQNQDGNGGGGGGGDDGGSRGWFGWLWGSSRSPSTSAISSLERPQSSGVIPAGVQSPDGGLPMQQQESFAWRTSIVVRLKRVWAQLILPQLFAGDETYLQLSTGATCTVDIDELSRSFSGNVEFTSDTIVQLRETRLTHFVPTHGGGTDGNKSNNDNVRVGRLNVEPRPHRPRTRTRTRTLFSFDKEPLQHGQNGDVASPPSQGFACAFGSGQQSGNSANDGSSAAAAGAAAAAAAAAVQTAASAFASVRMQSWVLELSPVDIARFVALGETLHEGYAAAVGGGGGVASHQLAEDTAFTPAVDGDLFTATTAGPPSLQLDVVWTGASVRCLLLPEEQEQEQEVGLSLIHI